MTTFLLIVLFIVFSIYQNKKSFDKGWIKAHYDIADEIKKTGTFYAGDEVFKCEKVEKKEG